MGADDENADLRKRLAELEAKVAGPPPLLNNANWVDEMRAISERRMNFASPPLTRDERKAMEEACGPGGLRDIVAKGSIPSPSGQLPATSQVSGVHTSPGIGRGWQTPIGPPPGIDYVDQQLDAQDRRDRVELAKKVAEQKLAARQK
jgi:hypothetical protein